MCRGERAYPCVDVYHRSACDAYRALIPDCAPPFENICAVEEANNKWLVQRRSFLIHILTPTNAGAKRLATRRPWRGARDDSHAACVL